MTRKALLIVDPQNDFMPGGALAVAHGDEVVPVANALMRQFELAIATQDWHPVGHLSFASSHPGREVGEVVEVAGADQVLWPDHCVQGTPGASFHPALDMTRIAAVVHKGLDREIDSYSAFFDNAHRRDTGLHAILAGKGVRELVIVGLATDYCVLWSALDAAKLDYAVKVVTDGVRAVDMQPGDGSRALRSMAEAGCDLVDSARILAG